MVKFINKGVIMFLKFRAKRINDNSVVTTNKHSLSDFFFLVEHGRLKDIEQFCNNKYETVELDKPQIEEPK